jgi:hypothetical protein
LRTRLFAGVLGCILLAGAVPPVLGQTPSFDDVDPAAFYAQDVEWLVARGITTGVAPRQFGPELPVTRGQAATFLYRYSGQPVGMPAHGFVDVSAGDYYDSAVRWAFLYGITSGVTSTQFGPGGVLNRSQLVTMLHRCAGTPGGSPDPGFTDVDPAAFYAEAVAWARQTGVTTGTGPTTFSPGQSVTRGQIASFMRRMSDTLGGGACIGVPPDPAIQPDVLGPAPTGTVEITILNAAPEPLRFSMGGPVPIVTTLDACPTCTVYSSSPPPGACDLDGVVSKTVTATPGRYRVVFEPLTGGTKPLFAEWLLEGGTAYGFCVVVVRS